MPSTHKYGLTDLVQRPTSGQANLTLQEKLEAVQSLLERQVRSSYSTCTRIHGSIVDRVATHRPRILALVSYGIWDCVLRRLDDTMEGRGTPLQGLRILPAPTDWSEEDQREDRTSGRSRRGRGFARWKVVYPGS